MRIPDFIREAKYLLGSTDSNVLEIQSYELCGFLYFFNQKDLTKQVFRNREIHVVPKTNDDQFFIHKLDTGEVLMRKFTCGTRHMYLISRMSLANLVNHFINNRNRYVKETYGENAYIMPKYSISSRDSDPLYDDYLKYFRK
jgi:hypothetical protein